MSPEAELAKDRRAKAPQMQHRHFAYIARLIADLDPAIRKQVANHFATNLRYTNPAFDTYRFIAASGIEQIEGDTAAKEYEEILAIQK